MGVLSAVAATGLTVGGLAGYRRYWRRIRNADYVTSGMLDRKKWVKGIVTRYAILSSPDISLIRCGIELMS